VPVVVRSQLGRRNLTDKQRTYFLGRKYEVRKKRSGERTDLTSPHGEGRLRTAKVIASEEGVSHATVERAAEYARSVDELEAIAPGFREKALVPKKAPKQKHVVALAKSARSHPKAAKTKARSVVAGDGSVADAARERGSEVGAARGAEGASGRRVERA